MYEYMPQYQMPSPNFANPYMARLENMQSQMQPANPVSQRELIRVNGLDGAKSYQIPPNSAVALFDGNEDIFYIKTSDAAGLSNLRKFTFSEVMLAPAAPPAQDFVTRAEYDELKGMIQNVEQLIRESKPESKNEPRRPNSGKQSHTTDATV